MGQRQSSRKLARDLDRDLSSLRDQIGSRGLDAAVVFSSAGPPGSRDAFLRAFCEAARFRRVHRGGTHYPNSTREGEARRAALLAALTSERGLRAYSSRRRTEGGLAAVTLDFCRVHATHASERLDYDALSDADKEAPRFRCYDTGALDLLPSARALREAGVFGDECVRAAEDLAGAAWREAALDCPPELTLYVYLRGREGGKGKGPAQSDYDRCRRQCLDEFYQREAPTDAMSVLIEADEESLSRKEYAAVVALKVLQTIDGLQQDGGPWGQEDSTKRKSFLTTAMWRASRALTVPDGATVGNGRDATLDRTVSRAFLSDSAACGNAAAPLPAGADEDSSERSSVRISREVTVAPAAPKQSARPGSAPSTLTRAEGAHEAAAIATGRSPYRTRDTKRPGVLSGGADQLFRTKKGRGAESTTDDGGPPRGGN